MSVPVPPSSAAVRRARWKLAGLAVVFGCLLAVASVELLAQLYCAHLQREWAALRARPNHLFRAAQHPVLAYELKPDYTYSDGKRRVFLNAQGIRDTDSVPSTNRWKVALLGDSVTFGQGLDQADVFTEMLQSALDQSNRTVKVLNFGVPGHDAADVAENLRLKDAHFHADAFFYLLNLNDYARKDTRFEGADNGLYRMYRLPLFKTPLFVRKAVYRWHKQGKMASPGWYRWLIEGNFGWADEQMQRMADYARERHKPFTVLILPAGCAYSGGTYGLQDLHDRISAALRARAIKAVDLSHALAEEHTGWFDATDHLTPAGNRALARFLEPLVVADHGASRASDPVPGVPPPSAAN